MGRSATVANVAAGMRLVTSTPLQPGASHPPAARNMAAIPRKAGGREFESLRRLGFVERFPAPRLASWRAAYKTRTSGSVCALRAAAITLPRGTRPPPAERMNRMAGSVDWPEHRIRKIACKNLGVHGTRPEARGLRRREVDPHRDHNSLTRRRRLAGPVGHGWREPHPKGVAAAVITGTAGL
jgi:hypothetical protein